MLVADIDGSASIGVTEYSLPSASTTRVAQTKRGRVWYWVDLAGLSAGVTAVIRVYEKIGATQRQVTEITRSGVQSLPAIPIDLGFVGKGWDVTVTCSATTTVAWSERRDEGGVIAGDSMARVLGLLHQNAVVDNTTTDANGVLTAARLRVFVDASAAASAVDGQANNAGGEIQRYTITGLSEGPGAMRLFRLAVDL